MEHSDSCESCGWNTSRVIVKIMLNGKEREIALCLDCETKFHDRIISEVTRA